MDHRSRINDNDILDYLMTSDFNDGYTIDESRLLLLKFRQFYRTLQSTNESLNHIINTDKKYIDYEMEQISKEHMINQEKISLENGVIKEISLKHSLKENYLELIINSYRENPNFQKDHQMTYVDLYDVGEKDEIIISTIGENKVVMGYSYKNI